MGGMNLSRLSCVIVEATFAVWLFLITGSAVAEPGGIILYETSNWTGESLTVHEPEISNLRELGWDNRVRSFTVTAGTWVLYRDGNYWGENPHDVFGPYPPGSYTFGDDTDGPSANTTSLRRMPETGVTLFQHSYLRGLARNYTTSEPDLIHPDDYYEQLGEDFLIETLKSKGWRPGSAFALAADLIGVPNINPFDVWLDAVIGVDRRLRFGNVASSYWYGSGEWIAYDEIAYGGESTPLNGVNRIRNDSISSLRRVDDKIGSEIGYLDPSLGDNLRLLRPNNDYVALDSGNWGRRNEIVTNMEIRLNGFGGTSFTTCLENAFFHVQHLVRLPNKNGRAYFMTTMSATSADLDRSNGALLVFRMDEDAYDAETDLIIDTPGTDGEYIWSRHFNSSSPIGDWNQPGKIDVLDGIAVIAASNWQSAYCDARPGVDEDAVLFYDVRDPEDPKYWGRLTAGELVVAKVDAASLGVPRDLGKNRRVINSVALSKVGSAILLTAGSHGTKRLSGARAPNSLVIFKAKNGWISPNISSWEEIGFGSESMATQHGLHFNSLEENAAAGDVVPGFEPGVERIVFFDGLGDREGLTAGFTGIELESSSPRKAVFSSIAFQEMNASSGATPAPLRRLPRI